MNNQSNNREWLRYIETLRQQSQPVKIDVLLQKRMQAFIEARQAKVFEPNKQCAQTLSR